MTSNEIVVGFDVSPSARAALEWAAGQARSTGWTLRALHVLDWASADNMYAMPVVEDRVYSQDDRVDSGYRHRLEQAFASSGPEEGWSLQLGQGHAGRLLVDQSRDAQLLVVGSREHVGLERILIGSASHYCVNHAKCPVVVVPIPAPKSLPDQRARESSPRVSHRASAS
jgi:nucleotide-binding universal stress UspA family protein